MYRVYRVRLPSAEIRMFDYTIVFKAPRRTAIIGLGLVRTRFDSADADRYRGAARPVKWMADNDSDDYDGG
jgi:hypothetical protein